MNKLDLDNLDTEFYVERAYELRRLYVAAAFKKAALRIKAMFKTSTRTKAPLQASPAH